jgi:very-short-patch-repair endonuclease
MRTSQPWQTNRARVLRSVETAAEAKIWSELRARRLGGFKFSRQVPINQFYADFVCRERKVIVEIDGGTHSTPDERAADRLREAVLVSLGYRIFRVHNTEVYENLDGVLNSLLAVLKE